MSREELLEKDRSAARSEQEFKAYNEEITSMNEELRAANEELETSKEELQAVNEEPSAVNNQLRLKVNELHERTADRSGARTSRRPELDLRSFSPRAELETNAAKYGALSNETGRVEIRWSIGEDAALRLTWREIGGPAPARPGLRLRDFFKAASTASW